ncbi:uncharacterized protein G2W53_041180 [Senna tora]|uniref:Uncharacterized protein n=1 Tax=Senna tora TaxID=362788 RepID=A0A834W2N5_9FABA|nr:uncharacterized protein G2W53_041180 [Senna tora]
MTGRQKLNLNLLREPARPSSDWKAEAQSKPNLLRLREHEPTRPSFDWKVEARSKPNLLQLMEQETHKTQF